MFDVLISSVKWLNFYNYYKDRIKIFFRIINRVLNEIVNIIDGFIVDLIFLQLYYLWDGD